MKDGAEKAEAVLRLVLNETSKNGSTVFEDIMKKELTMIFVFLVNSGLESIFETVQMATGKKWEQMSKEEQFDFVKEMAINLFIAASIFNVMGEDSKSSNACNFDISRMSMC